VSVAKSHQFSLDILEQGQSLGFGLIGIAPAQPSQHAQHVRQWIAQGKHGEMHYLETNLDKRLDPTQLLEGARSIIMVADAYEPPTEPADGHIRVAAYAQGRDYHKVIKKRLHQLCDWITDQYPEANNKACVDTAPLLEREVASEAGLGWIGKNTLLIHPRHGSYMLLGAIVTTLDLATSKELNYPQSLIPPTDHCGGCTRCIDACPTQCITNDPDERSIDASRCISYLTIEHRSEIDADLQLNMGNHLVGCDICQQVCPWNQASDLESPLLKDDLPARYPLPIHFDYQPKPHLRHGLDPNEVIQWNAQDRQNTFQGSAAMRVKLEMFQRNAAINLENQT